MIASEQGGGVYSTIQVFSSGGSYAEVVDINRNYLTKALSILTPKHTHCDNLLYVFANADICLKAF